MDIRRNARAIIARVANNSPLYQSVKAKSVRPLFNAFGETIPSPQNGFIPVAGRTRSIRSMGKFLTPENIKAGSDAFLSDVAANTRKEWAEMIRRRADRILAQKKAEEQRKARLSVMQKFAPKITDQDMIRRYLSNLYNR